MPGQYRGPELVIQTPAPANSSTGFRATNGCKYHHEYLAVYEQLRQEWDRRLQEGRGVHFVVRQAVWGHFPEWTSTLEGNAPTSWVQSNASQEIPQIPAVHPRCGPVVYSPSKIPPHVRNARQPESLSTRCVHQPFRCLVVLTFRVWSLLDWISIFHGCPRATEDLGYFCF